MLWVKVLVGAGLLALGYYVGRETGRTEGIRRDLEERPPPEPAGEDGPAATAGPNGPPRQSEPSER